MRPLRVSAISFLNTAPLMWDFEHNPSAEISANFIINYTVPSACARALRDNEADVGIIPAFTYAEIPDLVIVPQVAIAANGPVRLILLISKMPLEEVRTVAVDTSSRTSVALTQVTFCKWFGGKRELVPMEPDLGAMLAKCDAALLIGDSALLVENTKNLLVYDLAEVWNERTGKPFVFAFWAVRQQALSECKPGLDVAGIFQRSRDHGMLPENLAAISHAWTSRIGLSAGSISGYLRENIQYYLDHECLEGLNLFFQYSKECGLIREVPGLRFI